MDNISFNEEEWTHFLYSRVQDRGHPAEAASLHCLAEVTVGQHSQRMALPSPRIAALETENYCHLQVMILYKT